MSEKKQKTILLVEDEVIIAMQESNQLKNEGYEVIITTTGQKAIDIVCTEKVPVDLILMDIDLGKGMDGTVAALEILKEKDIPILFLSSHTEKEIVQKTEAITNYGYVVKDSNFTVLDASIKMAFKLFEAKVSEIAKERKLVESEKRYRAIMTNIEAGFVVHAPDTSIIMCNKRASDLLGLDEEQLRGRKSIDPRWKFIHEDGTPLTFDEYPVNKILKSNKDLKMYQGGVVRPATEDIVWLLVNGCALKDDYGNVTEIIISFLDMTKRKMAEAALKESQARLALTVDIAKLGPWEYDVASDTFLFNNHFYAIFRTTAELEGGYTMTSAQYANRFLHPDDRYMVSDETKKALDAEDAKFSRKIKHRIIYADGEIGYINVHFFVIKDEFGRTVKTFGVNQDITEHIQNETKINNLLKEKELILKEVHHRIKNNMSSIKGILSLQAETVKDPSIAAVLFEAESRIQSMMVLYDKLYRSDNFHEVSVKDYIPSLIDEIFNVFPNMKGIKVEKKIEDFFLSVQKILPMGIIINELITNIMKYAFVDTNNAVINVSAFLNNKNVILILKDNGIGLPESIDFNTSTGFGMQLVSMLTEQIDGTIKIERVGGTKFILEFPMDDE